MVEITALTKMYGNQAALDAVSLSLAAGQTHVLLGSSGSGKSTLLRTVLGLVPFEQGTIEIDGISVLRMSPTERAERIGYVPQEAGLFPHLTASDNVTLVARSRGWSRSKISDQLQQLNRIIQLDGRLLGRFPSELSGGQRQRVALLRSLFLDPQVILMDEPFGALDPLVRADILGEVKALFSRLRKTVIFVTHDIGEGHFLADHIVLIHQGRVVQQGLLQDLIARPASPFVTRFLQAQRLFNTSQESP